MEKKAISGIMLTLLLIGMLTLASSIKTVKAGIITVPDDYPTIQEAINHANAGDTIFVKKGTYSGPIVIDKTLSLQGEDRDATIIDGGTNEPSGSIVLVAADNVKISGFTIQHCRGGGNAVYLDNYVNMTFSYNIITGCNEGVRILHSSGNVVSYNIVQDCYYNTGVGFDWSYNNIVHRNTIIHNHYGLSGGYDIHNNTYSENTIINNDVGFGTNMYDDKFFHNNFVNNGVQVIATGVNQFDDGYPSGGNYWSDYTGQDSDGDEIGDTPYTINDNNRDRYPFMQQDGWGTPPPPVPKKLSIKLSGGFDYSAKENVKVRLASMVKDANTLEPVSDANVTIQIYFPNSTLWVSDKMVERLTKTGIYEWESSKTIYQMKLKDGVYLVYVNASVGNGPVASDMLLFHIDPPLEDTASLTSLLYYATATIVLIAGTTIGVVLLRRHRKLQKVPQ